MNYHTLISADQLLAHINDPDWVIVDCRFSLADSESGFTSYRHGHIPNARYAHLDCDLSSPITALTGRHPLPYRNAFINKLGQWGINNDCQVIVYDEAGGAFAGRLWWLLRYFGHDKAAVLDGGLQQWQKRAYPITTALPIIKPSIFRTYVNENYVLSALHVENGLARKDICLLDARTSERFQGKLEPIDPIAGHIPGAINRPFQLNLNRGGLFLPADDLRQQFSQLIGSKHPDHCVHMCGSGVTACHNVLAMEIAGLTGSKLYAGSWSEWIRDKNRSVETA